MMRVSFRFSFLSALLIVGLTTPSGASAQTLQSEGGFAFDIQSYDGSLADGSMPGEYIDAYDTCYQFVVNGTNYNNSAGSTTTSLAGRQVDLPEMAIGTLTARRFVYVPATGGDYARFLDVVTNNGTTAATVTMAMACNLGSDSSTAMFATSSGDLSCTADDAYCDSDDNGTGGDPQIGTVFQGTSPPTRMSAMSFVSDQINWSFSVTIPPGGQAAMLTFGIQKRDRASTTTESVALSEPDDAALTGLDTYLDAIFNFGITTAGAPRVHFTSPSSANEGAAITIEAAIDDPDGDPTTWSWDLNGDGTFGDLPGGASYTVPAGTTDGPGTVRVGIEASDGTNVTQRYRTVSITNVAPTITSRIPSAVTGVGGNYTYQLTATDPAGAGDPFTYTVVRGPTDMAISATGLMQWVPDAADVTRVDAPIAIELAVNDGDEGVASQTWDLQVSPNRTPSSAAPIYPINEVGLLDREPRLIANNATDADFDPLTYTFELDAVSTFDSPALQTGVDVAETPGYSFWYVTTPLTPGRWYWRVRASDGTSASDFQTASFYRVPDATEIVDMGTADAGMPDVDGGTEPPTPPTPASKSGCSVGAGEGSPTTWTLSLVGLACLLAGARRRRR
jgi:hypothetical protein